MRSVVIDRPDQRDLFASIRCPVLVVAAREDSTFPPHEVEIMARSIPGAKLTVIEDAAHLVAAEVPAIVNELVETFLAGH